jgi:hypothetical protein
MIMFCLVFHIILFFMNTFQVLFGIFSLVWSATNHLYNSFLPYVKIKQVLGIATLEYLIETCEILLMYTLYMLHLQCKFPFVPTLLFQVNIRHSFKLHVSNQSTVVALCRDQSRPCRVPAHTVQTVIILGRYTYQKFTTRVLVGTLGKCINQ